MGNRNLLKKKNITNPKPVLYFPHEQSGRAHGQRGRGLLVFILLKAYTGGLLPGRVPYMHSRSA